MEDMSGGTLNPMDGHKHSVMNWGMHFSSLLVPREPSYIYKPGIWEVHRRSAIDALREG